MKKYENILVALDLSDESAQVLARALKFKEAFEAKLTLIHVIEPLGYAYGGDIPMDLTSVQDQLETQAKSRLEVIGKEHGVDANDLLVMIGRPETEIHRLAKEGDYGLVIVGSHGRHGIQLLLGSTANSILHGAHCDVLAVRLED
jgi:universal stress protein A